MQDKMFYCLRFIKMYGYQYETHGNMHLILLAIGICYFILMNYKIVEAELSMIMKGTKRYIVQQKMYS